jgi:hypothetical protein
MSIWRVYKIFPLALSAIGWGMVGYLGPVYGSNGGQNLFNGIDGAGNHLCGTNIDAISAS